MIDISLKGGNIILTTEKKEVIFNTKESKVTLDSFDVNFAGEYEKSEILLEVKSYEGKLIYKFYIDGYNTVLLPTEQFEKIEDILPFFGDVDLLVLPGTKTSIKLYENIEAKIVLPYGEEKDIFLNSLGQHKEEVTSFRIKGEILGDVTEFINLA